MDKESSIRESAHAVNNKKKPWRKILYEQQDYPDNYVDKSFLEEMKKNVNVRVYDLPTLVYESGIVSQQLSSVCIFVSSFVYMDMNLVSPTSVLIGLLVMSFIGNFLFLKLDSVTKQEVMIHSGQDLKSIVLFTSFVYGLSPILKTLTETISTDTIYAMTVGMLATNILLHDYVSETPTASRSASLNASIFAAVCLASRLPSSWHAFVTVMLAMQIFAVIPQLRIRLKNHEKTAFVLLTVTMGIVACAMVAVVSYGFAVALAVSQFAIVLLFPWWMMRLQRYKNNIHGPWDEAIIKD
ncbi:phosphatidylinositol N-acetylglucosaminyltransferase subunit C-like isoform X2 [Rhopilema esculentum]|uniref:phosphatidylinositol N-acetylglucosaminyltransferase subunit C-like isoform X2 n=1 Tax=Rhopilema esculentum TaxID=499914 RepID=UPI0031CFAE25